MTPFVPEHQHIARPELRSSGRQSFLRFFFRYPIFLLAFGPPLFRPNSGIDATKGLLDVWAFIQVGWIGAISARAIYRLASADSIHIPKQVRSVFRYAFLLGLLFFFSAEYSPSRYVSVAYSVLYFLTLICVVEFIVDAYQNPPDWVQCLFHLRLLFVLLFILVLCMLPFFREIIMTMIPGVGIRLSGGLVAPVCVICPAIAVISCYAFLFSLEKKSHSVFLFLIGLGGTMVTQSRGCELGLLVALALVGIMWAGTSKRSNYLFIASTFGSILLACAALAVIGGGRVWNFFNRGQDLQGIESASGRTEIWGFVLRYCMAHPLGMGYIAGFRVFFRGYFALDLQLDPTHIGNAHNEFMDVLAGAGWPALAVFLFFLGKTIFLGWRYIRRRAVFSNASYERSRDALRCALALLVFCLVNGIDAADFTIPLRTPFYLQTIFIALMLGISARMIAVSRLQRRGLTG